MSPKMLASAIMPFPAVTVAGPSLMTGRIRWYALVSLLLLAACLPEFLTGSTQVPQAISHPPGFAVLIGLYGGGALLIREATVRWGKRWAGVLLLGGAYAIGEEGFAAKTMTDPTGSNIGTAALYSSWAGINWVPLAAFTLFHAAFSIAFQLLLVELLFPQTRGRRLLGKMGLGITMVVYGLVVILLSLGEPFVPPLSVTLFLAGLSVAYIAAAYFVPKTFLSARSERPDRSERTFVLLGVAFMGGFFLLIALGPHFFPWQVAAALYAPLAGLTLRYLVDHAGRLGNDAVKIAFALGIAFVFVPIDTANELSGDVGVLAFTALVLILLIGLRRRWKHSILRSDPLILG